MKTSFDIPSVFDAPVTASSPVATTPEDRIILHNLVDQLAKVPEGKGLSTVVDVLRDHGLGAQTASWSRSASNVDVSGTQLKEYLKDSSPLTEQWAETTGQACQLSSDAVFDHLAYLLPAFIQRLSPRGELPSNQVVQASLESIRKRLSSSR